jgi:hypothetical protein
MTFACGNPKLQPAKCAAAGADHARQEEIHLSELGDGITDHHKQGRDRSPLQAGTVPAAIAVSLPGPA